MNLTVGCRALVINLEGKHDLHGTIVYVECVLHEGYDPDHCVYGVIGGDGAFEYHFEGINLLPLDDNDDHVIGCYSNWETF